MMRPTRRERRRPRTGTDTNAPVDTWFKGAPFVVLATGFIRGACHGQAGLL